MIGASGLWVPIVLSIALVGFGVMLGWIMSAFRGSSVEDLAWNDGYGVGYLQGLRDASRNVVVTDTVYAPDHSRTLEEDST